MGSAGRMAARVTKNSRSRAAAQSQQAPKQGQFHLVGGVCVGRRTSDIGYQLLEIVLYLVYSLLCVGSHGDLLMGSGG